MYDENKAGCADERTAYLFKIACVECVMYAPQHKDDKRIFKDPGLYTASAFIPPRNCR